MRFTSGPKAVWIDFANPQTLATRLLRYSLLGIGFLALGLSIYQKQDVEAKFKALSWQQTDLQRQLPGIKTVAQDDQQQEDQYKRAKMLQRELDMPWNALFDALQGAMKKDIAIISVSPSPQQHNVTLQAMATDINAVIDFSERLKASKVLTDVQLLQEDSSEDNELYPLLFSISANWVIAP